MALITNQPKPKEPLPLYDIPGYVCAGYRRFGRDWVVAYLHATTPYRSPAYFYFVTAPGHFQRISGYAFQRRRRPRAGKLHV